MAEVTHTEDVWDPSQHREDAETLLRRGADAIRLARMICAATAELLAKSAALRATLKHYPLKHYR